MNKYFDGMRDGTTNIAIRLTVRLAACFFVGIAIFAAHSVSALTIVEQTKMTLAPGESKRVFLSITNQNAYTWYGGSGKTSLYLYGSSSPFRHSSWLASDLPVTISQPSVKPGQIATASFMVQAPAKSGLYVQRFLLGTGSQWHEKTVVQITFDVRGTTATAQSSPSASASVAPVAGSGAQVVDQGGQEWQADPDAHIVVTVRIKNTGSTVWKRDGIGAVGLYIGSDKSPFRDTAWKNDKWVSVLTEASVSPGQTGTVAFELRAPSVPGKYQEPFELRAGESNSIAGSRFVLPITVRTPDSYVLKPGGIENGPSLISGLYAAAMLLKPRGPFAVTGNATVSLQYGIKNTGSATWNRQAIRLVEIVPNLGTRLSSVQHETWLSSTQAKEALSATEPGRLGIYDFKIKAPAKSGTYTVRFALQADGNDVQGGEFDIPITVTADGYIAPEPTVPVVTTQPPVSTYVPPVDNSNLPNEPIIRVGLYATDDDTLMVKGVRTGFVLQQNGSATVVGNTVCSFEQGETATVVFDRTNRVYRASGQRCQTQSTQHYVAVATDGISPLEVTDISRPVSWLPGANDNKFRGKLELRYTPKTDLVWVINELPIEYYLKGIAETSDVSPMEFQKTLLVAARTYAMYHVERGTKHADEYYIVDAKYDQVYRGYGQEARSPSIVAAVEQTKGIVVSYNGKIAITPYFSRSDGRTRTWSEVWGGTVEWCIGVPVPQDIGKTLWGHGVGMSASGALTMAAKEGKTYDQILKYFYTGIELRKWYK